jgi:hypothetical protein
MRFGSYRDRLILAALALFLGGALGCGDDEGTTEPAGDEGGAPRIFEIRGPTIVSNALDDTSTMAFDWSDDEGDIDSLVITLVADPNGVFDLDDPGDSSAFDPGYQGRIRGTTTYALGCAGGSSCLLLGKTGPVTLGFTLVDAAGNRSERAEYSYTLVQANR